MLRTNLQAGTAAELWSRYMQLTEAEASFRALKSELSIRPLFHQLEPRVKDIAKLLPQPRQPSSEETAS